MMVWEYRVILFYDHDMEADVGSIHEVFYEEDGSLMGYAESPAPAFAEAHDKGGIIGGLRSALNRMLAALDKPALRDSDFPPAPDEAEQPST